MPEPDDPHPAEPAEPARDPDLCGEGARTPFARAVGELVFPGMNDSRRELYLRIAATYDWTFGLHGRTARAALWHSRRGQHLRFGQLARLFEPDTVRRGRLWRRARGAVTINDLGCGYGPLFEWLDRRRWLAPDARYIGYDLSERMIESARRTITDPRAAFYMAGEATEEADYSFASGTFGMKLDVPDPEWELHCGDVLKGLWAQSRRGLAFNMLNIHGRHARLDDGGLYYADPDHWAAFAERKLGAGQVSLLARYSSHDFTVLAWRR
ncbi:class I SAM-dependent methyltransferase [Caenispirillum salinarum]|uniref:class I SAM-dependent methyltransferase n=1 Tax=Caenispirillum salinarum TaxID=859058 RepID=UPI00384EB02F